MLEMPRIRIEVESMKTSIITCLNERHQDLIDTVNKGIDAAIVELPVSLARQAKSISEDVMHDALQKALTEYWESGKGRDLLDDMIHKKFTNTGKI
jgi:hypothetical protein